MYRASTGKFFSSNGRPNISRLNFNNVGFESCSMSIRVGLVKCAMITIVVVCMGHFRNTTTL